MHGQRDIKFCLYFILLQHTLNSCRCCWTGGSKYWTTSNRKWPHSGRSWLPKKRSVGKSSGQYEPD